MQPPAMNPARLHHVLSTLSAATDSGPLATAAPGSLWALGGGALAIAVAGWWFWARRPGRVPSPTPAERAVTHLEAARKYMEAGRSRIFCGVVSMSLRYYLEEQFQLDVTGRTTEEFLASLPDEAPPALYECCDLLAEFLACCDFAKYAGYELVVREMEDTLQSALEIVEATSAEHAQGASDSAGAIVRSQLPASFEQQRTSTPR